MTEVLLKMVLYGPKACGKTALSHRLTGREQEQYYTATVGVDFGIKIHNEKIKFHIWDLSGNPRFASLMPNYIKLANVIVLVYDTSIVDSVEDCRNLYIQVVLNNTNDKQTFILVGTHSDKPPKCTGQEFANKLGIKHILVSSKTGSGVDELVEEIKEVCHKIALPETKGPVDSFEQRRCVAPFPLCVTM
jgi:small GTP-binding protein